MKWSSTTAGARMLNVIQSSGIDWSVKVYPPRSVQVSSNRQDAPKVIWIDLPKVKLDPGSPVVVLNPDSVDLSGDVSDKLKEAEKLPY